MLNMVEIRVLGCTRFPVLGLRRRSGYDDFGYSRSQSVFESPFLSIFCHLIFFSVISSCLLFSFF